LRLRIVGFEGLLTLKAAKKRNQKRIRERDVRKKGIGSFPRELEPLLRKRREGKGLRKEKKLTSTSFTLTIFRRFRSMIHSNSLCFTSFDMIWSWNEKHGGFHCFFWNFSNCSFFSFRRTLSFRRLSSRCWS